MTDGGARSVIDRLECAINRHDLEAFLVLDHLGKHGSMTPDMRPVWSGAFLCGPGITCLGADWRIRSMAADLAEPGDVIVLAAGGLTERACFGDMTATCWKSKGIEGVVVDGAARDVARLRALAFPVFARGVTPRNFHYPAGLDHGAVNVCVVRREARTRGAWLQVRLSLIAGNHGAS